MFEGILQNTRMEKSFLQLAAIRVSNPCTLKEVYNTGGKIFV